jgi:hypothetical protein
MNRYASHHSIGVCCFIECLDPFRHVCSSAAMLFPHVSSFPDAFRHVETRRDASRRYPWRHPCVAVGRKGGRAQRLVRVACCKEASENGGRSYSNVEATASETGGRIKRMRQEQMNRYASHHSIGVCYFIECLDPF